MNLNRIDSTCERGKEPVDLGQRKTMHLTLFSSLQHILIFEEQGRRREWRQSTVSDEFKDGIACPIAASKTCDQHRRIQYDAHLTTD